MDNKEMFNRINELLGNNVGQILEEGGCIKLRSVPYMDLTIEAIGSNMISMTHYYKLNGDLVPDPDMEIVLDLGAKTADAVSYQDIYRYDSVYTDEGIDQGTRNILNSFLAQWLVNLKAQRFSYEKRLFQRQS